MNKGFVEYLNAKHSSKNTIKNYTKYVDECLTFIGKPDNEITLQDLDAYKSSISDMATASIALKLNAIKAYFKYLKRMKLIDENIAEEVEIPKVKNKVKPYIDSNTIRALLDNTYSARNRAVIATVASTGMRMEEMSSITMEQYSEMCKYGRRTLTILGKGDKERTIYINDMAKDAIDEYIAKKKVTSGYLFESYRGEKLDDSCMNRMLKTTCRKAGIPDNITMHCLRVAFATIANKKGVPVGTICQALGHASLATTTRYIKASQDDINEAMANMQF